ncbi:MAG TPA: glycosyltransferase family 4 protein [Steroidobacteraceae bacterium]|nr:glycosyltransferase family 4 protein [Steroidobacteraceae bacterium]
MSQMEPEVYVLAGATLATSVALTLAMRKFALSRGLLDVPNERSSHKVPTPRGGGAAITLTAMTGFAVLTALHRLDFAVFAALAGGLAVAAVGFLDDRHALPAAVRLSAHVTAALWALAWLGGLPALRVGDHLISLGALGTLIGMLGIVWVLNLFNFMDGIDGLAAAEATFVAWSGALLAAVGSASGGVAAASLTLGASSLGFLRWNWPPARIFMGDVGSGYLGYVIAVLALVGTRENPAALWAWLILGGVFFVDATVTLLRRLLRGERAHEAHRSHAYQWLARRWGSHGNVTLAVMAVNLIWLLPCAVLAMRFPGYAAMFVIVALAPLAVLATALGSGRAEASVPGR